MEKETYVAVILYEGSSTSSTFTPGFEEITLLVEAVSSEDAEKKAKNYGISNQPQYDNEAGDTVKWTFLKVESTNLILEEITSDITPIHSKYFRNMETYTKLREMADVEEAVH